MDIKEKQKVWSVSFSIRKQNKKSERQGKVANINEVLAQELHKTLIKKFKRKKVHVRFSNNTWAADLAEMRPLSSSNRGMKYLLREIDVFTKYA